MHPAIVKGNVAVITGAGFGGLGFAFAQKLLVEHSLKVVLADINEPMLTRASEQLEAAGVPKEAFSTMVTDVTKLEDCVKLADATFAQFGGCDVLHLNAGIGVRGSNCWTGIDAWRKTLDVNLWGVVNGAQAFVGRMLENRSKPGLVICTGSKQGITSPPGNASYNVSKAAVKMFAEQLSHELRNEDKQMDAALLVPGWVYTKMTSGGKSATAGSEDAKPAGAWTAGQTIDYMLDKLDKGAFYIVCPDNETSTAMDKARIEWSTSDLLNDRPALSRWHPEYKDQFQQHLQARGL